MEDWIGPAIIAAFIAGVVSIAGWFVTSYQAIRMEQRRRREKVRDFQIALRAEIRSELADLTAYDLQNDFDLVVSRYSADPEFSVFVPNPTRHLIFEAIVAEIHILPEDVIDPVVLCMRQRQAVGGLCGDIRAPEFRQLARERQLEIYRDYVNLRIHLRALAEKAIVALGHPPQ